MEVLTSLYELQIKQLENTQANLKENELELSVVAASFQFQSVLQFSKIVDVPYISCSLHVS
jgi:hypothetical protein